MIKFVVCLVLSAFSAFAYVPTVESLFRHGGNPDVTSNTVTMTLKVSKLHPGGEKTTDDVSLTKDKRAEDFYKLYFTNSSNDSMKIAQTRYANNTFSESSLEHKTYYPNFTAFTIKSGADQIEKGIFFAMMRSIILNDGGHIVKYLKSLNVPVKLNNELFNREKIEYLASYKRYLIAINRDRKKNEVNPLRPEDAGAREKVEKIMGESMYVDTKQVRLTRDNGSMAWMVSAGGFEGVVSYEKRHIQSIKFKSESGEFEITCHDYWLSDGTHYMPKYLQIKNFTGETFQVDIGSFRHYTENEGDLVRRLQKWDQLLRGKDPSDHRPEFLL